MQEVGAAPVAAGPHSEKMTGFEKEASEASAGTGWGLREVEPERGPQGIPEGSWSEGEADVGGQAVMGVALEAGAHDVGWVETEVGLWGLKMEPESEVSEEKAAFEGEAMLQTG